MRERFSRKCLRSLELVEEVPRLSRRAACPTSPSLIHSEQLLKFLAKAALRSRANRHERSGCSDLIAVLLQGCANDLSARTCAAFVKDMLNDALNLGFRSSQLFCNAFFPSVLTY